MPQIYSVDGDLKLLDELMKAADRNLKDHNLANFSYGILESLDETFIIECKELFENGKIQNSSFIDELFKIIQTKFPERFSEMKFKDFIRGRLFCEDSEFRWQPREPNFTFVFFVKSESADNIQEFSYHEALKINPIPKRQFLWGKRENGKYKDGRVPQDLDYPFSENYVTVDLEEYWEGWQCAFSRFCKLKGSNGKGI
jgi:hypothetical protein